MSALFWMYETGWAGAEALNLGGFGVIVQEE